MKMFGNGKVWVAAFAAATIAIGAASSAHAKGPLYEHSRATKVSHKLMRGIGNITFGWVEIPWNMHKEIQNLDPFTGSVVGFYEGAKHGAHRTIVGVSEFVTFPVSYTLPLPGLSVQHDFDPVLLPEFVLQDMNENPLKKKLEQKSTYRNRPASK